MSKVYVLFWFDVEDYLGPMTDEALKRLLDIFDRHGVRASWKLVGEKLRVMEQRGRRDIITSLSHHDVGYHSDFHTRHPHIAEYCQDQGWEGGVAQFASRERRGYDDIRRVFGRSSICYGQPGNSWVPQAYPVLRRWGIPLYLDGGTFNLEVEDGPFWYCGMLHVFGMRQNQLRVRLSAEQESFEAAQEHFDSAVQRLLPNGGVIGIYYHPCEFVNTTFTCPLNFSRGNNPPRSARRPAPLKPAEAIEEGFDRFERYLAHVSSDPRVEILGSAEFVSRMPDAAASREFNLADLSLLARSALEEITWQKVGDAFVSAQETFSLLVAALAHFEQAGALPESLRLAPPLLGPASSPPVPHHSAASRVSRGQLLAVCRHLQRTTLRSSTLPASVRVGGAVLGPADFLATTAAAYLELMNGNLPSDLPVRCGRFTADRHVGEPSTWRWGGFPPEFAGQIRDLACLQAWTIKPAAVTG